MESPSSGRRAVIIGASYAGLVAAVGLQCNGWSVHIIEKSTERLRTGGGVVVQPRMLEYLQQHGVAMPEVASIPARTRKIFRPDGSVVRMPESAAAYTSWDVLLRELETVVDGSHIRRGATMVDLPEMGKRGEVVLDTGEVLSADIVIGADGIGSRSRQLLLPGATPQYAGYVAWRGMVEEDHLEPETVELFLDSLCTHRGNETTIILYEVPRSDGDVRPGRRRINWVWYQNVPPGEQLTSLMTDTGGYVHRSTVPRGVMTAETLTRMRELVAHDLCGPFAEVVMKSEEPFVQKVEDLTVPRLVFGRTVLIGDAASLVRPHIGSGTAKAVDDAMHLAHALGDECHEDPSCLAVWEQTRLEDHAGLAGYAKAVARRLGLGVVKQETVVHAR
ncbi:MAG: FAD-dependent monooxygenase [Spirochaetales bacterium]|nr:FAD-dependent monooxygenase [Spirochaetales bacterium]